MTDLVGFRAKIRYILGDASAVRYSNDVVDEALRWALAAFGKALPQVKSGEVTVTSAGREQDLSSLIALVTVLQVNYPYASGEETPAEFFNWDFYQYGGKPYMRIGGNRVPAVDEGIRLVYAAGHAIKDLDSAASTTVMALHDYMLANGAAGKAAIMRASQLVEAYGKKAAEPEKLDRWGRDQLAAFELELMQVKTNQAFPGMAPCGWVLDEWDR